MAGPTKSSRAEPNGERKPPPEPTTKRGPPRSSSLESCSVASEESAAVVSVFHSWSSIGSSCSPQEHKNEGVDDDHGDDDLTLDCRFSNLPLDLDSEHLLNELRKRLPPADLPPRIHNNKRRRRQPVCRFLHCMGSRLPPLPVPPPPPSSVEPWNELGFAKQDALFPVDVTKATNNDENEEDKNDPEPGNEPPSSSAAKDDDDDEKSDAVLTLIQRERPASPVTVMKALLKSSNKDPASPLSKTKLGVRGVACSADDVAIANETP